MEEQEGQDEQLEWEKYQYEIYQDSGIEIEKTEEISDMTCNVCQSSVYSKKNTKHHSKSIIVWNHHSLVVSEEALLQDLLLFLDTLNPPIENSTAGLSDAERKTYISTLEKLHSVISKPAADNEKRLSESQLKEQAMNFEEDQEFSEWIKTFVALEKKRVQKIFERGVYCRDCQENVAMQQLHEESPKLDREIAQLTLLKNKLTNIRSSNEISLNSQPTQEIGKLRRQLNSLELELADLKKEEMKVLEEIRHQKKEESVYWEEYYSLLKERNQNAIKNADDVRKSEYFDTLENYYNLKNVSGSIGKSHCTNMLGWTIQLTKEKRVFIDNLEFLVKTPPKTNWVVFNRGLSICTSIIHAIGHILNSPAAKFIAGGAYPAVYDMEEVHQLYFTSNQEIRKLNVGLSHLLRSISVYSAYLNSVINPSSVKYNSNQFTVTDTHISIKDLQYKFQLPNNIHDHEEVNQFNHALYLFVLLICILYKRSIRFHSSSQPQINDTQ